MLFMSWSNFIKSYRSPLHSARRDRGSQRSVQLTPISKVRSTLDSSICLRCIPAQIAPRCIQRPYLCLAFREHRSHHSTSSHRHPSVRHLETQRSRHVHQIVHAANLDVHSMTTMMKVWTFRVERVWLFQRVSPFLQVWSSFRRVA